MTRKQWRAGLSVVSGALVASALMGACGAAGNDVPSGGGYGAGNANAPTVVAPSTVPGQGSGSSIGASTPASSPGVR